ncbi:MAG: hypothetical protein AAFX06_13605 [Planctomycetota bacterium]
MRVALILCVLFANAYAASTARAQNGQLIEGLFKTWANSQLEKERMKRAEAEQRRREAEARRREESNRPPANPYELNLPSGFGQPAPRPQTNTQPAPRPRQINVRSREVADYARQLSGFASNYGQLVQELRVAAPRNTTIRAALPSVYEVSATCDGIFDRIEGASSLAAFEDAHRLLDSRYRQVAFRLRSVDGLSDSCNELVRKCDESCSGMLGQFGFEPQFDRRALQDVMISASAYIQALVDDLELTELERGRCRQLTHDARLFQQRLVAAGRQVQDMPYDECVARFNDFATRWRAYSERIYALDNPYLSRKLDRISECGDQVYGLLWMPTPRSLEEVAGIAHRINFNLRSISQSVSFYSMAKLPPQEQSRLISAMRDLARLAGELETRSAGNAGRRELRDMFADFDRTWCSIQPQLGDIPAIRTGLIAETERGCRQLREIFGISGDYFAAVPLSQLVGTAAALEGASEVLDRTINKYDQYLQPSSYRRAVVDAARSFLRHSREVHELISRTERLNNPDHLDELREETEQLLADWRDLDANLQQVQLRGLSASRAASLRRAQQQVVPLLGEIAAALSR